MLTGTNIALTPDPVIYIQLGLSPSSKESHGTQTELNS